MTCVTPSTSRHSEHSGSARAWWPTSPRRSGQPFGQPFRRHARRSGPRSLSGGRFGSERGADLGAHPEGSATSGRGLDDLSDVECLARALLDGKVGNGQKGRRDHGGADDGIAPLVEREDLWGHLGTVAVAVAGDWIDLDLVLHRHGSTPVLAGRVRTVGAVALAQRRPSRWAATSLRNTESPLRTMRTTPSGCAQAPRPSMTSR